VFGVVIAVVVELVAVVSADIREGGVAFRLILHDEIRWVQMMCFYEAVIKHRDVVG
jgi:hypothetical protein